MVVPGQHLIVHSSFYWCASGVNPTQNHPAFSANSSTKTINVTTTKLVSISSDLCLSHSLRHLCPWGKQAGLKGNLGEKSQELFLWRLVGGGQQGSRLDKTVLKSSLRDWASYFSFLNGGTPPPPPKKKRRKGLLSKKLDRLGEVEGITAERSPGNRAFLYYTQSCVPSEPDPGKYSNLLVISCRQDI